MDEYKLSREIENIVRQYKRGYITEDEMCDLIKFEINRREWEERI